MQNKMETPSEILTVEKIENGFITRAETPRVRRTMYHSNTNGVIAEFNRAFGIHRLNKELTKRSLDLVSDVVAAQRKKLKDEKSSKEN